MRSVLAHKFEAIIDTGVKTMSSCTEDDLKPHFIYCCYYYPYYYSPELQDIFLKKMRKYGIQSALLTTLCMLRKNLITKEKAKQAAEGKLKNDSIWKDYEGSINDDLESFFKNPIEEESYYPYKIGENIHFDNLKYVRSFFLPRLSEKELKLVEEKTNEHMKTFQSKRFADVDHNDMAMSESTDKYLHGWCERTTIYLSLDFN